jgi:Na+/proline symporter
MRSPSDLQRTVNRKYKKEEIMVTKIYALVSLLMIALAGLLYFTGIFNELILAVFGFALSTHIFAGLVLVLPWWMDKRYTWKY